MSVDLETCGSVLQDAERDRRHLCIEEEGHGDDHICWAGAQCATWTNRQERKPRVPIEQIPRKWDDEMRRKMAAAAAKAAKK